MCTVQIDWALFDMAFATDADYQNPHHTETYLELSSGRVLWIYPDDESATDDGGCADDNRKHKRAIQVNPVGYLRIPMLTHDQHHEILRGFLESHWCDDPRRRAAALDTYLGPRSIGFWLRNIGDDEAVRAYYEFRNARIEDFKIAFLANHGIAPDRK